jgi:hypothetical protein
LLLILREVTYLLNSRKLRHLRRLLNPRFVEIAGGIFYASRASIINEISERLAEDEGTSRLLEEVNHNKTHIEFSAEPTPLKRWKQNYIVGETVRFTWETALNKAFPRKNLHLILLNDFHLVDKELGGKSSLVGWEIIPTLRLWSATGSDPDPYYHEIYRVPEIRSDRVLRRDSPGNKLSSMQEILREVDQLLGGDWLKDYEKDPRII